MALATQATGIGVRGINADANGVAGFFRNTDAAEVGDGFGVVE